VRVFRWHPQPPNRIPLEIKLDHHGWLRPEHPAIVSRLDRDRLRSDELDRAVESRVRLGSRDTRVAAHHSIGIYFVDAATTPGVFGMASARIAFTSRERSDSPISTRTISIPVRNAGSSSQ
jgi:hypothetical protein